MSVFLKLRWSYLLLMLLLMAADHFLLPIPLWVYLALSLLFLLLIVLGSSIMSMNFFARTYTRLPTAEKVIALTFDDGPSAEHTPAVLAVLKKWGAKASFFCIGERIAQHQELVKHMAAQGHTLGNHSYTHSSLFSVFGKKKVMAEIQKTNQLIREATGQDCYLFRPPFGVMNPPIAQAAKACNMQLIGWSIRSFDTSTKDPQQVVARVLSKIGPGAVILLHDDRENTPQILEAILAYAHENNYHYKQAHDLIPKS